MVGEIDHLIFQGPGFLKLTLEADKLFNDGEQDTFYPKYGCDQSGLKIRKSYPPLNNSGQER
jgi:hypothetical protein